MTVQEIVREAGMSARPGYYSGRGATTSDLNGEILYRIYSKIKQIYGKNGANAFVDMIKAIKKLSATAFLNSLYMLEGNNWKFNENVSEEEMSFEHEGEALGGILSMISGMNKTDMTDRIRSSFLEMI